MKTRFTLCLIIAILCVGSVLHAHTAGIGTIAVRSWTLRNGTALQASLLMLKDQNVSLEIDATHIQRVQLSDLCDADQQYVLQRYARIATINREFNSELSSAKVSDEQILAQMLGFVFVALVLALTLLSYKQRRLVLTLGLIATIASFYGFRERVALRLSKTSTAFLDSAFAPYKKHLVTSWNTQYYLVENNGIPEHPMMAGITGWQQQVPLPQCYTGSNAWSIPLNPVMSASPIPVNADHFSRGAIALAVNGISIFNPYTNTGVDALVDGQLDNWGGHCGRADDYHYHVAPLHLYGTSPKTLPIAFALDGFAVYGAYEPDGTAMQSLDANHGHLGNDGVYHYHGTQAKPYMVATMVGQVTEDTTHQIVPQAAAHPVRPSLTPLKGAVITDCTPNGTMGYTLSYTLNGGTYKVAYSWTANGNYTFNFISPNGSTTTSTYKSSAPCLSVSGVDDNEDLSVDLHLLPNPASARCRVQLGSSIPATTVQSVSLYNCAGERVYSAQNFEEQIELSGLGKGLYLYCLSTVRKTYVKKLFIE